MNSNNELLEQKVLFITPPFTQLNTPYPATAYLKGFLNTLNIPSFQVDLGIEVILRLFSSKGLTTIFKEAETKKNTLSDNSQRIIDLQDTYLQTIDTVIAFLHDTNPTLAYLICERNYLPEASRFEQLEDLEWAFGTIGIRDKARHLATLYLEDISDLIIEAIDPYFGFSRYAERLGRSASTFDQLHKALINKNSHIDLITIDLLANLINSENPTLVALSAPFPGNLYSAFKCGQWIKKHYPTIKVALGGGYANTELRSLKDSRVFEFVDFITLDDGERPLQNLLEHLAGKRPIEKLKRTFTCIKNEVTYYNGATEGDYKQKDVGTPDYTDLPLKKYLSVIELANPMHRLWSDGRWNKLTLAHGCYWGKCTFCDVSLDYIKTYEAATAKLLVDRIEELIEQTGNNGFHFVDEAAPPALMRDLALEILRRKLTVVWWTNIRFEKSFSFDLCRLLARSGCIAVSGGLEVASDRLLNLIDKGVTVQQVAKVADNFTQTGIMVHAYLMYGFPTQTAQETIDSMEMVRQLFELGIVQSGFWHQFALTAHSPIGLNPDAFKIKITGLENGSFANNDLEHDDPTGADHSLFSDGLKKSLFNYMHGIGFEMPLHTWFDFKTPRTLIPKNYIERCIDNPDFNDVNSQKRYVWIGPVPNIKIIESKKKGKVTQKSILQFNTLSEQVQVKCNPALGNWIFLFLRNNEFNNLKINKLDTVKIDFESQNLGDFETFFNSSTCAELRDIGLLIF